MSVCFPFSAGGKHSVLGVLHLTLRSLRGCPTLVEAVGFDSTASTKCISMIKQDFTAQWLSSVELTRKCLEISMYRVNTSRGAELRQGFQQQLLIFINYSPVMSSTQQIFMLGPVSYMYLLQIQIHKVNSLVNDCTSLAWLTQWLEISQTGQFVMVC